MTDIDELLEETLRDLPGADAPDSEKNSEERRREQSDETEEVSATEEDSVAANIARTLEALRVDASCRGGDDDDVAEAAFSNFFTSLTAGVCSRDVLLEPITILLRDFQLWMSKNEKSLADEDRARYHKQIALYSEIQTLLTDAGSDDLEASSSTTSTRRPAAQRRPSNDTKKSTAHRVQSILFELQKYGSPPLEVTAELPQGGDIPAPTAERVSSRQATESGNQQQQSTQSDDFTLEDSKGFSDFLKAFGFEGEGLNPSHLTPEVLDKLARGEMASQEVTDLMGRLTLDDQTFANVAKVAQDAAGETSTCTQQ